MSTRGTSWWVNAVAALGWQLSHLHCRLYRNSGNFDLQEPSGPIQACTKITVSFDHLSLRTAGCHSLPEFFTNSLSVCHSSVPCSTAVHLPMSAYKQNNALISSVLIVGLFVVVSKPDPRGHQTSRNVTNLYGGTE